MQKLYGIVLVVFPEFRVETLEEKACPVIPTPLQVIGEVFQPLYPFWNLWEASCLHQVLEGR